jgi:hypothetical protein
VDWAVRLMALVAYREFQWQVLATFANLSDRAPGREQLARHKTEENLCRVCDPMLPRVHVSSRHRRQEFTEIDLSI